MRETAKEEGMAVDLQRSRFDIDLAAPVKAIRDARFLSAASLSGDEFRDALEGIVEQDRRIRNVKILDAAGKEILNVDRDDAGDSSGNPREESEGPDREFREDFIEELRSLSSEQILISEFSTIVDRGKIEPAVFLGTGLFYPSGARAGYVVVEVGIHEMIDGMVTLFEGKDHKFFLISSEGRWIYDSRAEDPWENLRDRKNGAWIIDEYPEVWQAMVSTGDGSISHDGLWIYRKHVPLETRAAETRQALRADGGLVESVRADPVYVLRQSGGGPSWSEVWLSMAPIIFFFLLTLGLLIPALLRKRQALKESYSATRKLSEAALRTRMAMDSAGVSELRIDLDSGKIDADKRLGAMLLFAPGEKLSTVVQWEERIHPQDRRKVLETLDPLWEEGEGTFSFRHRMKRGDGCWGWYRFRGSVRSELGDSTKVILGAYIDLTDVVLRDAELNRLEMATRQTLSGIAILDKDGVLEWSNPAFRDRPERAQMEIQGEAIWNLYSFSEGEEREKSAIRKAIFRGSEFSLTSSINRGETYWTRVVGNPVLDEVGIPSHYVVIESDISREKRAEADLRKSESLLTESQRLAGIGSWEVDLEEDSIFWSDEIYRIFGISDNQTPSTELMLSLCAPESREQLAQNLKRATEQGEQFQMEFRFVDPSGEEKWIFCKGMALIEGKVTSKIYGVAQDISSRKGSEHELKRAKDEAERLNDQLAEALDKAHLSERKAQEASEAKSSFLSMISHEIRNPLNGVIGMADLLRQTELDDVQEEYVQTIHSSGSTVVMLLDDILDFTRLEHGKIMFEEKRFSVEALVEETVLFFSARIAHKGLDFSFFIDPDAPDFVTGDITRVKQILYNLLGNAVKFTDAGSITLEVELKERRPNDRCLLMFSVQDTGMGIPDDRKDRIFQSFSQVDPSITRKFGGSGLGLAISKELSLRMGGNVHFESEESRGTRFEVSLPFPSTFGEKPAPDPRFTNVEAIGFFGLETREKHLRTMLEEIGVRVKTFAAEDEFIKALELSGPETWIFVDEVMLREGRKLYAAMQTRGVDAQGVVAIGFPATDHAYPFPVIRTSQPVTRKRLLSILQGNLGKKSVRQAPQKRAVESTPLKSLRILVAEDNAVNQKVIRLLLKRMGYDCEVVENGRLALEKVKEEDFDLILMDIQMPEMDGMEATAHIVKEVSEERRPRIVALTAGATSDNREEAAEVGMDGYLTKPVQSQALEAELQATEDFLGTRST
tara:strand:+ start:2681 stop:6376 length:3696 start_codon:yes stop_codon:yes gene_type:complete